jgi:hypothetical protein
MKPVVLVITKPLHDPCSKPRPHIATRWRLWRQGFERSKDAAKAEVGLRGRSGATVQWFLPGHTFVMSREPATHVERVCWIIAANHF